MNVFEILCTVGHDEAMERIKEALAKHMQIIGESENAITVIPRPVASASVIIENDKIIINGFIFGHTTAHACNSILSAEFAPKSNE